MIRLVWAIFVAANLAACSTPMKLDNVPVEDRISDAPVGSAVNSGGAQSSGQSTVAAVNTTQVDPSAVAPAAGKVVYFDYDSFVIRPEFQGLIETSARRIQANTSQKLAIEGHTDERGGRE